MITEIYVELREEADDGRLFLRARLAAQCYAGCIDVAPMRRTASKEYLITP